MKYYNCRVRVGGNLNNEVPKSKISAAEVTVLREIHGFDAVVDLKEVSVSKKEQRSDKDERLYLARELVEEDEKRGTFETRGPGYPATAIEAALGHKGQKLQQEIEDLAIEDSDNEKLVADLQAQRAENEKLKQEMAELQAGSDLN